MLTEYEAQKIRSRMLEELNAGPRAVWQCAAGLLLAIALAVAAVVHDPAPNHSSNTAQPQSRAQASFSPADDLEAQTYRVETEAPSAVTTNRVPVAAHEFQALE